jgi:hypothetical protein
MIRIRRLGRVVNGDWKIDSPGAGRIRDNSIEFYTRLPTTSEMEKYLKLLQNMTFMEIDASLQNCP